jgi:rubrerythrin
MAKLTEMNKEAPKKMATIALGSATDQVRKYEKISLILKKCIRIETYTIEKYKLLANQTTNPHAKVLFERLSSEGKNHAKVLEIIRGILTETGKIDKSVAISSHVAVPKDTKLPRYATDVEAAYHAMKSHLELERGAEEIYAELAEKFENPIVTSLFRGLAEDEKTHHEELLLMIETFEKMYSNLLKKRHQKNLS